MQQPTITSNVNEAVEGDLITLKCETATKEATRYKFYKDTVQLTSATMNTFTIPKASLDSDNGKYTCIAYFENVPSKQSTAFSLLGKIILSHLLI